MFSTTSRDGSDKFKIVEFEYLVESSYFDLTSNCKIIYYIYYNYEVQHLVIE